MTFISGISPAFIPSTLDLEASIGDQARVSQGKQSVNAQATFLQGSLDGQVSSRLDSTVARYSSMSLNDRLPLLLNTAGFTPEDHAAFNQVTLITLLTVSDDEPQEFAEAFAADPAGMVLRFDPSKWDRAVSVLMESIIALNVARDASAKLQGAFAIQSYKAASKHAIATMDAGKALRMSTLVSSMAGLFVTGAGTTMTIRSQVQTRQDLVQNVGPSQEMKFQVDRLQSSLSAPKPVVGKGPDQVKTTAAAGQNAAGAVGVPGETVTSTVEVPAQSVTPTVGAPQGKVTSTLEVPGQDGAPAVPQAKISSTADVPARDVTPTVDVPGQTTTPIAGAPGETVNSSVDPAQGTGDKTVELADNKGPLSDAELNVLMETIFEKNEMVGLHQRLSAENMTTIRIKESIGGAMSSVAQVIRAAVDNTMLIEKFAADERGIHHDTNKMVNTATEKTERESGEATNALINELFRAAAELMNKRAEVINQIAGARA